MTIPLDGVRYKLRISYVFREQSWTLDIMTDTGGDILVGIKLVPDIGLISRFQVPNRPPGEFVAVDTSGAGLPAGRNDFGRGRRVRLRYTEAE
jgi:hypothetical protein